MIHIVVIIIIYHHAIVEVIEYRYRHHSLGVNSTTMERVERKSFEFDEDNRGPHQSSNIDS